MGQALAGREGELAWGMASEVSMGYSLHILSPQTPHLHPHLRSWTSPGALTHQSDRNPGGGIKGGRGKDGRVWGHVDGETCGTGAYAWHSITGTYLALVQPVIQKTHRLDP